MTVTPLPVPALSEGDKVAINDQCRFRIAKLQSQRRRSTHKPQEAVGELNPSFLALNLHSKAAALRAFNGEEFVPLSGARIRGSDAEQEKANSGKFELHGTLPQAQLGLGVNRQRCCRFRCPARRRSSPPKFLPLGYAHQNPWIPGRAEANAAHALSPVKSLLSLLRPWEGL